MPGIVNARAWRASIHSSRGSGYGGQGVCFRGMQAVNRACRVRWGKVGAQRGPGMRDGVTCAQWPERSFVRFASSSCAHRTH